MQEEVEHTQVEVEELEPAAPVYAPPVALPAPPAPAVVPAPGYPLRPLPPITLQEVEHAYFSQQYPQQRPISEVIGSQNFFFLQESEIDSPVGTPQPPILNQPSPPGPIPTQTFTNQHYVQIPGGRVPDPGSIPMPPQPHFAPHPEHAYLPAPPLPHPPPLHPAHTPQPHQVIPVEPTPSPSEEHKEVVPVEDRIEEDSKDSRSPERDDDRKVQGQGDGQNRYRRYRGGGGGGGGRGSSNGFRGRGSFQNRQNNDGYHPRHNNDYQNRSKDGYQGRQYDGYQNRHKDGYQARGGDAYYGNGDAGDAHHENGGHNYQGFKGRGRGARGGPRGAPRPPRAHPHQYNRRPDNVE